MPPPREHREPVDLDASAIAEARATLDAGDPVRVAVGRTVVICTTLADVREAIAGRLPRGARRLDAAR